MEKNVTSMSRGIMTNVDVSVKKQIICEIDYVWNLAIRNCGNGKYLASIMDNLAIICDEVIKWYDAEIKTTPTNFKILKFLCFTCIFINYYNIIDSC